MREIPLANGKGVALVDDEDYERVSGYKWHLASMGYAATRMNGKTTYMHRLILGVRHGEYVDHVDGNALLNTRTNLRTCIAQQNQGNAAKKLLNGASRYKGVTREARAVGSKPWVARIKKDYVGRYLGSFATEEEAARAYDDAARAQFREFACLNYPRAGERGALGTPQQDAA